MTDLIANGDLFLPIRTKINGINEYFKIAETDADITAGAVTSIPVVTLTKNLLNAAAKVTIVDALTGVGIEVELSDDAQTGDEVLTITSYTFTADILAGAAIYYKYSDLLSKIYVAP